MNFTLGLKHDDFVLIYPARLDKNKNQEFLIRVMKKLLNKYSNIHLLLPGVDELNGEYQKIAEHFNLQANIHFLGFRSDIPELMKISNVSVASSRREGLPVNIIEAMASGLPIVCIKCRGVNELVKQSENGYILDIESDNVVDEFSEKIEYLYNNKDLSKIISENNIKSSKKYELKNIINEYEKIYFKGSNGKEKYLR